MKMLSFRMTYLSLYKWPLAHELHEIRRHYHRGWWCMASERSECKTMNCIPQDDDISMRIDNDMTHIAQCNRRIASSKQVNDNFILLLLWCHNGRGGVAITNLNMAYSTVHSGADQRKYQSSASLVFVRGIQRPVTQKMFPFDDITMALQRSHPL